MSSLSTMPVSDSRSVQKLGMTYVTCCIRGVEKVYLTVDVPHNHLCLVFTCAKTREAVNSIFRSEQFPEIHVPGAVCEKSDIYWSAALDKPSPYYYGMIGEYIQTLITAIGKKISPDEPLKKLPILFFLPSG